MTPWGIFARVLFVYVIVKVALTVLLVRANATWALGPYLALHFIPQKPVLLLVVGAGIIASIVYGRMLIRRGRAADHSSFMALGLVPLDGDAASAAAVDTWRLASVLPYVFLAAML